jgi:hypothetical protein
MMREMVAGVVFYDGIGPIALHLHERSFYALGGGGFHIRAWSTFNASARGQHSCEIPKVNTAKVRFNSCLH